MPHIENMTMAELCHTFNTLNAWAHSDDANEQEQADALKACAALKAEIKSRR